MTSGTLPFPLLFLSIPGHAVSAQAGVKGDMGGSEAQGKEVEPGPHQGLAKPMRIQHVLGPASLWQMMSLIEAGCGTPSKAALEWACCALVPVSLGSGQHTSFSLCSHQKDHV